MANTLASKIRLWARRMDYILEYDEPIEVGAAFVDRDWIHDTLAAGAAVSSEEAALLAEADRRLVAMRGQMVARFPEEFRSNAPPEYWWWHLDDPDIAPLADVVAATRS